MSTWGRAQDALLSILDGYGLEDKDRYEITEDIIAIVGPIFVESGRKTAKAELLAEMTEVGITLGDPK
jgi:hypothetical protein